MSYQERWFTLRNGQNLYFWDNGDPLSDGTPALSLERLARNSKKIHGLAERLAPAKPGPRRVGVWKTGHTHSLNEPENDDAIEALFADV